MYGHNSRYGKSTGFESPRGLEGRDDWSSDEQSGLMSSAASLISLGMVKLIMAGVREGIIVHLHDASIFCSGV